MPNSDRWCVFNLVLVLHLSFLSFLIGTQGAVALTIGSVPRIIPKLRLFHWLLKMNNQCNLRHLGTILRGPDPTVSATAPRGPCALAVGSVPRRIVPKLRHLHWLLKINNESN